MNKLNGLVALAAAASMGLASAAQASEQSYRIDANSQSTIDLSVCSASVYLQANGDGDTDLDFWLYDNAGNLVHSDTDSTDITFFTISNGSAGSGRCLPYQLKVQNFGDVYNNMTLSLTDQGATSSGQTGIYATKAPATNHVVTQSVRSDAESSQTYTLSLCAPSVYLEVRGDGDTDLDFWLYDNFGNVVHTDTDNTDITFYTISNGSAGGGRCLPYRLKVQNFGNVYNNMTLSLTDQGVTSSGQTGIYATKAPTANRTVTQSVRSEAESSQTYTLNLCAPSVYLEVRGDGDTDLDFWVYDESGREVHSDTDSTDITFATLSSGRGVGSCAAFELRIHNYGSVYNQVEIKLTEQ